MSVRAAAVAGRFYPADADELKAQVHALLAAAANRELPVPKAVIAPHAGYVYSGPVAACAYSTLRQAPVGSIERVVLLGPCHRVPLRGLALADVTAFDTPLGTIEIDRSAGDLLQLDCVQVSDSAHELEHSLEVQLPFLTQALAAPFKIVPLVVGETTTAQVRDVLRALWGGPETLIVVSSDLSHFYSYEEASSLDGETSRAIEELTPERIRPEQACGRWVIQGLLEEARERGMRASILDVRNSGDTARASLRHGVGHGSAVPVAVADHEEQLQRRQACFMTLRKDQDLRGCMGSSVARRPLIEDLARNAYAAGFLDPRLGPVEADELGLLDIHISVFSDLEELSFESEEDLLSQVRPGVDGLLLKAGSCRSTLLPAVWNTIRESAKLVDQLKAKAGLKPHCWSDEVRMFRYTTENLP